MGIFTKKRISPCPACSAPLEPGHLVSHTRAVDGGFIFECSCGHSTMKWPDAGIAAMAMEIHCDHDHGTSVSPYAGDIFLHNSYKEWFPRGSATSRS